MVFFLLMYSTVTLNFFHLRAGSGGVFWLELIGGTLLAVHKVLLRMALVNMLSLFVTVF